MHIIPDMLMSANHAADALMAVTTDDIINIAKQAFQNMKDAFNYLIQNWPSILEEIKKLLKL